MTEIVERYNLPGGDLIASGLEDLARDIVSVPALLVSIGAPRLERLGYSIPNAIELPERRLYGLLHEEDSATAHSRFNALVRRLVSFERAAECVRLVDADRIRRLMHALGQAAGAPVRIYFTGGATAVLLGWRESTIDIHLKMVPEPDAMLRAIPRLKEELRSNVELASPSDFIPVPSGWEDRSPFIDTASQVSYYHFDLYAQALAKVERGHQQDLADVREMVARGLVEPEKAKAYFERIEPDLYRYPAIHGPSFRRAVVDVF